jgi:hypothetical protein
MRNAILFILVIMTFCAIRCDKGSTVGPGDQNPVPDVGTYIILPHGVVTSPPHEVHLFCNVVDTSRTAVDFLTADRFSIKENETFIDPVKAALLVQKRNTFDYRLNTLLLLDVSTGINLDVLKEAARAFVSGIDPMQSIAVYAFSNTLNMIQDFTQDSTQLINAVEGITEGTTERNLYGAIWQGFNLLYSEVYSLGVVQQGNLAIFTAGNDTENENTREEVIYTSKFVNVYTIGLGSNLDSDFLVQTGNRGYIIVSDLSQLVEAFTETQASIVKFGDSFYWASYQSALRGAGSQEVEMSISANAYNGLGSTMKYSFDASQFEDVQTGITINWSSAQPEGIDSLIIGVNVPRTVKALSQGGEDTPVYEWSSSDPGIMTVEPITAGFSEAILLAAVEGNTLLIVKDTANNFADTVQVRTVQLYGGFICREWWNDVTGVSINDLISEPRYPDFPDGREYINNMEAPVSFGDNYGTRLRGFVCPDSSGTYSFWIASDDASQLFISMNENPDSKALIASVDSWTNSRDYDAYPSQHSDDFELEAGKFYYIEALHKEGSGGDNISVAWQGPGITRNLIPSENLCAWLGD